MGNRHRKRRWTYAWGNYPKYKSLSINTDALKYNSRAPVCRNQNNCYLHCPRIARHSNAIIRCLRILNDHYWVYCCYVMSSHFWHDDTINERIPEVSCPPPCFPSYKKWSPYDCPDVVGLLLLFSHWVISNFSWSHGPEHARPSCLPLPPRVWLDSCS